MAEQVGQEAEGQEGDEEEGRGLGEQGQAGQNRRCDQLPQTVLPQVDEYPQG